MSTTERNNAENISNVWQTNDNFRQSILDELIKDCIHMEVAGIVSAALVVRKLALKRHFILNERPCPIVLQERKARSREDAHINAYLEDQVVTDSVYLATENIVWEALWDQARKLKKRQIEDLEAGLAASSKVDSHMLTILRENYMKPLSADNGGQSLINKKWAELLYHTNRYMQRGSLMDNYAIRKLQEQIIGQVSSHSRHQL